jgi:membrane protein YqaA with SNARE-associated domain
VHYIVLYLVSIISPLLALAEPLVVLSAMSGRSPWVLMVIIVAAGQCTGFGLLYFFGDQIMARLSGLKRKLEAFDFHRFERSKITLTALSGIFGIPPATVLSAAGPVFESRWIRFFGILFAGRLIRFGVLALIPATFVSVFNPELLPEWVRNLF